MTSNTQPPTNLLSEEALATLEIMRNKAAEGGYRYLEIHLASLTRKLGRQLLEAETPGSDEAIDWRSWRRCDLGALELLKATQLSADEIEKLYFQGDAEERIMILKALQAMPEAPAAVRLLQEAHRTNDQLIFEAAYTDGDLAARVLDDGDFNRGILKAAFIDLPYDRMRGAAGRANETLSAMLLDFMSEREAAGRPVWAGSLELAAHAPCPGLEDRVRGALWHGADAQRLVAARAAVTLAKGGRDLGDCIRARLEVEKAPAVRDALAV